MSENIQVPKGWEVKKLGEVVEIHDGTHTTPVYTESGIKFISVEDIENYTKTNKYISEKDFEKNFKYKPKLNDIFLTRIGSIGIPALVTTDEDIAYYVTICLIHDISNKIDSKYLYYCFQGNHFQKELYRRTLHVAFPIKINLGEIGLCTVLLPPLEEQKKIAEILSLWDKAIEQTKELITYKEKQKKGLMQALLTGKKRLNGFTDEWKTYQLGEIVDKEIIYKKGQPLTAENANNGIIPVIAAGREIPYFHDNYNFQNIITISASGAYAGYIWYHNYPIWASDCSVLYGKKDVFDTLFLFYILKLQQNRLYSLQTGGAQPHIYKNDICQLFIPKISFCEQKAIADILSSADEEINLLNKQLELYSEQKKGLMQNLLTGKVRV